MLDYKNIKGGKNMSNNINARIIALRKEKNMSQEVLSEKTGVSKQTISEWERGETTPDITSIIALADTFGLSIDEFIYGEEFQSNASINKKRKNAIGTIASLICTITYLYISFIYGLWHPGWLVFLLIPIVYALLDYFEANKDLSEKLNRK